MSRSTLTSPATTGALAAVIAVGAVACGPAKDSATGSDGKTTPRRARAAEEQKAGGHTRGQARLQGQRYLRSRLPHPARHVPDQRQRRRECCWERAKDAKDDLDSVLANDDVKGQQLRDGQEDRHNFKTTDCKDSYAVTGKQTGTPKSAMSGNGMFKVGTDLQPGTYKSIGNADGTCHWERSKDALYGTDSITANDNVTGNAVVTITRTNAFFKSSDCGDWRKAG